MNKNELFIKHLPYIKKNATLIAKNNASDLVNEYYLKWANVGLEVDAVKIPRAYFVQGLKWTYADMKRTSGREVFIDSLAPELANNVIHEARKQIYESELDSPDFTCKVNYMNNKVYNIVAPFLHKATQQVFAEALKAAQDNPDLIKGNIAKNTGKSPNNVKQLMWQIRKIIDENNLEPEIRKALT